MTNQCDVGIMDIDFDFSSMTVADFNVITASLKRPPSIRQVIEAVNVLQRYTNTSIHDLRFSDMDYLLNEVYKVLKENMWLWLQEK